MNIRPKIPIFQLGGLPSTVTWSDPTSTWFTRSGIGILEGTYNMLKPLYDKWKSSGSLEDYLAYKKAVDNLNENQRYGYAPGHLKYLSNNNTLFKNSTVGAWQNYVRNNYNFINDNIGKNYNLYHIVSSNPNSGDNPKTGWKTDNLWAGETDDRTTWGNLLNSNDENYLKWKLKFSEIGIDYKTGPNEWNTGNVLYGFLNENHFKNSSPNNPPSQTNPEDVNNVVKKPRGISPTETKDKESLWSKLGAGLKNVAPDLLDALRLAGNMHNNDRVYNESMKAIRPNLQQSYHTYRQVVGDEATKLAYYRRAVQGQTKAGQPFTSDADRLVAYMNEAKRIGDELRAQGDLADNLRIRETSAESAAHTDANTERDTTVANNNATEILKAIAAKHQLTAQKYSADWTNIDLFLLGKLAKLELNKVENKLFNRQLAMLDMQEDLLGNTDLLEKKLAREKAWNDYYNNKDDSKTESLKKAFELANKNYQLAYIQSQRDAINKYRFLSAKSGTKLTYKNNTDKYLYKTSRDIVEHFRRMSKMTDDSRTKTLPKPVKLTSHPRSRKFLLGGVAPFTVYRPLGIGGETAVSTQTSDTGSSKSSKDTAAKDKLDMIKELFKSVQGLPIDASKVYSLITGLLSKYKAFGEEMSTDDIASMYLSAMNQINHLKYSLDAYNKAHAVAVANDSLDEIAVGINGEMALLNAEGEVTLGTYAKWKESEGKLNPLTNGQLLTMRAHSPNLAFNDRVFDIVNNGVGMTKIALTIKSMAASLGATSEKLEGISLVESNKVKAGLQILAGTDGTPDGYYQVTLNSKNSKEQVNAALNYIYNMLPKNYKTILALHSGSELNSLALIYNFLSSQTSPSFELTIAPLTGKASKDDKDSLDKLGINSPTLLLLGMSSPREFTFSIGNGNAFTGAARVSSITQNNNPIGADFSYSEIYKSDLHKNLDLDNASFGDVPINKALKDLIVIDNSIIAGIDLPYKTTDNGRIIPDFALLNRIEEADKEVLSQGIDPNTNPQAVNAIYTKHQLPIKYGADNKLTGNYKRFAVILATAIEDVFLNKDVASNGTLQLVTDEEEKEKYLINMAHNTGRKVSDIDMDRAGLFTGNKDIYKGSIFIPIIGDLTDAISATGDLKAGMYDDLRSRYNTKNYVAPEKTFVKQ